MDLFAKLAHEAASDASNDNEATKTAGADDLFSKLARVAVKDDFEKEAASIGKAMMGAGAAAGPALGGGALYHSMQSKDKLQNQLGGVARMSSAQRQQLANALKKNFMGDAKHFKQTTQSDQALGSALSQMAQRQGQGQRQGQKAQKSAK